MDVSTPTVSPLRQRMVEDMRMRKFEPKTQSGYLRAVRKLAAFLKASPDTSTAEDLRRFQMHLVDEGASPITLNATISGLKFFFDVTLSRGELMAKMQPVSVPHTLAVVLSREEVSRLIAAAVVRVAARGQCARQDLAQRLAVPWPGSDGSAEHPPAQPRHPRRCRYGQDRQARVDAHAAPLLRHALAGAEGRHPRDPGLARPCEVGDDQHLYARRHQSVARSDQPTGEPAASAGGVARIRCPTTPAATAIARSARAVRPSAGSMPGRPTCCRLSITTWSSRCRHPSPTSRTRTRP